MVVERMPAPANFRNGIRKLVVVPRLPRAGRSLNRRQTKKAGGGEGLPQGRRKRRWQIPGVSFDHSWATRSKMPCAQEIPVPCWSMRRKAARVFPARKVM
jgi:hypothetical protein